MSEPHTDPLRHWRLSEQLSVIHAALLHVGANPSKCDGIDSWYDKPEGYDATRTALMNAIQSGQLSADIVYADGDLEDAASGKRKRVDPDETLVNKGDLDQWFQARAEESKFFSVAPAASRDYLEASSEYFSPKLVAAIKAWEAVSANPTLRKGKTPKQALETWLTDHAKQLKLVKSNGRPNKQAIEEIAKIANWSNKGGAPPTPG